MEMPGIVGGSNSKALVFLEAAYKGAPDFSVNTLTLVKIYLKTGKREEAKVLLNQIVNLAEKDMLQDWIIETKEDQAKAKKILESL